MRLFKQWCERDGGSVFRVSPKIVRADLVSTVCIDVVPGGGEPLSGRVPRFRCVPMDGLTKLREPTPPAPQAAQGSDGAWYVSCLFEGSQEHIIIIDVALADGTSEELGRVRIYSLEADLYAHRPYKGDLHIHSARSDGKDAPAYVAAASRRIGMDFMAVTDHNRYEPSIEAQEAFTDVPIDMLICRGEEVHAPGVRTHVINFGGSQSVNTLCNGSDEARGQFERAVSALVPSLGAVPCGVDAREFAGTVWVFDRIRECGGLGIFCHPYWVVSEGYYHPSGPLATHIFDTKPFDAYEVIGGYYRNEADSNTLQVARYHEERAKGRAVPIVGSSDAHGCDTGHLFGWYYTIVFAHSLDQHAVASAIKGLYSVAVEAMSGEVPRAYGPLRLVKYALFVMRELMPAHDELCRQEGELMVRLAAGDEGCRDELAKLKGQAASLMESYWTPRELPEV